MAQVEKPNNFSDLTDANPIEVNENFDEIYNEFNGNIDHNNLNLTLSAFKSALLDAIKDVDGDGSGLNAELLKGNDIDVDGDGIVNEADLLDGQHYSDIQDWVNNNADVPNADHSDNADYSDESGNADTLDGKHNGEVDADTIDGYDIQKNGTDGNGIINFKT